ncbi:MAG: endonuclease/exonuclease/phosphatase family protein [Patescibacteria group bacterium]
MSAIKLITLNIEINRHWNDIIPFLERESPDIVCLQELFDRDISMLTEHFGYHYIHLPITKKLYDANDSLPFAAEGPAILTKLPLKNTGSAYYYKPAPEIQIFSSISTAARRTTIHQGIVWGTVLKNGAQFTIGSTHFTWTPDGKPNENQDTDIQSLFKILDTIPDLVLCGDFNVPRGDNRIYHKLLERLKDNVPSDVKTTIDLERHYSRTDPSVQARLSTCVVDYIFSTPRYAVSNVRCEFGLSDHCAIVANVALRNGD